MLAVTVVPLKLNPVADPLQVGLDVVLVSVLVGVVLPPSYTFLVSVTVELKVVDAPAAANVVLPAEAVILVTTHLPYEVALTTSLIKSPPVAPSLAT